MDYPRIRRGEFAGPSIATTTVVYSALMPGELALGHDVFRSLAAN